MLLRILSITLFLSFFSFASATPVDINNADADQIASALSGVGPGKAAAIIKYRIENGPFKQADDLTSVKGIGQKIIDKNRSDIIVNSPEDMSS